MSNYKSIYDKLNNWVISQNFKSYDLCDVKGTKFFLNLNSLRQSNFKLGKFIAYPFNQIAEKKSDIFRKIMKIEKRTYPQAQALIASSYLNIYKKYNEVSYLRKAESIAEWLIQNRNKSFDNFCWGQPYDWYSRKVIKKFTPRTTVSSQSASFFLDLFEVTNNNNFLEVAISVCNFFIDDLNWDEDADKHICFSYTTEDNYHIHNANMLAAAVLIRTWQHSKIKKFRDFGLRAVNFTLKHQNTDGSWFYWAPPDKVVGKIDHYHTGFVLESLHIILEILQDDKIKQAFHKGLEYYNNHLFTKNLIPKYNNKNLYPIDIQSLAQAIITYTLLSSQDHQYFEKAKKILNWTIDKMYDSDGYFYYRIYANNKIDKSAYIRWAESWMMRALSLIIWKESDEY